MVAAALTWRDHAPLRTSGDSEPWLAMALLICGVLLIAVAFANRRDATRPVVAKLFVVLATCAILAWTAIALSGAGSLALHRNVREWPAVTVLTLACAGALAFARPRSARWASVPVALAGLFSGFLGTAGFVDRFVNDPFIAPAAAVTVKTLTGSPLSEFSVEFEPSFLWLSPKGRYVALRSEDQREQTMIHSVRVGDPLTDFTADTAIFLDESRLVLLERQPRASVLHLVDLDAGNRERWSLSVPLWWADLSIDRSSERWRLLGWDATEDIVSAEGHLGDNAVQQAEWKSPPNSDDLEALAVSRGAVLALESRALPIVRALTSMVS